MKLITAVSTSPDPTSSPPIKPGFAPQARRRRRWVIQLIIVAVAVGAITLVFQLLPSPADSPPVVGVTTVDISGDAFSPPVIQVYQDSTVTWRFFDEDIEHNIVGEGWGSETPQSSGSFEHTFAQPGTYVYRCTLHFRMDGRVDVMAAQEGAK